MDPVFLAYSCFRRRKFDDCVKLCTQVLEKNPYDQAVWVLKTRALTEQLYVDEVENDEEGIAEMLMDDNAIASISRPGTSLKEVQRRPGTTGPSQGVRPISSSGRPLSGFVRPGTTGANRPGTMEQAIRAPRTAHTARPVTSASGRFVRLGTASMLSNPDGPFISLPRLNLAKYATRQDLAKPLFEYILYHENDVRNALELASKATEACAFKNWWWKVQLGKCYYRLGLFREAEQQFKSAMKQQNMLDIVLLLSKVYVRLDQPLTAIDVYNEGLETFPNDVNLLTGIARIYEGIQDLQLSVDHYKLVLQQDATHIESIASLGTNHFYSDQPEISLRFFRRLLQMGVYNTELFNNLGLCCFYAQQYDMSLTCFERSLSLASDENAADVWYNISHVAVAIGDLALAYQCLRMAISISNDHAEAHNNLGVLEIKKDHVESARAFFQTSSSLNSHLYEPQFNFGLLANQIGDLQSSFNAIKTSQDLYGDHTDSIDLMNQLKKHFAMI